MASILEVNNLRTSLLTERGRVEIVHGLSFFLEAGQTLAVMGESGCGKSITALSLMRLLPFGARVSGEVLLEGRDLLARSEAEMRALRGHKLAMVFQDPMTSLNPVLTIGEQMSEPLRYHLGQRGRVAWQEGVELLARVGLPDPEERMRDYPHRLSGGMRQRVMLALALACRPQVLIADEPTSALDVTVQAQIIERLQALCAEAGTAVLLITHDPGLVATFSDRVMVMYAGYAVELSGVEELFVAPAHPYTLGLLTCVPELEGAIPARLKHIPGAPPELGALPGGCPFHPRCPFAVERCWREIPPLQELAPGHTVACWEAHRVQEVSSGRHRTA